MVANIGRVADKSRAARQFNTNIAKVAGHHFDAISQAR